MSKIIQETKACLKLAIPLACAQLAQASTNFFDTVMMGLLGSQTIAGGGLGAVTFSSLNLIFAGILSASGILAAVAFGAHETQRVSKITNQGILLSLILSIPMMVLLWNCEPILHKLGQDPMNVNLAKIYLRSIVWGFPASMAFAVLRNILPAINYPRIIMVIMVGGVFLNVIANYILMFGKLGFPALGLAGIGWGSTITYWAMFFAGLFYISTKKELQIYQFLQNFYQFDRAILGDILHIGLPIGGLFTMEAGLFATTSFLMGYLGTASLAAHQIALQTTAMTFMVPMGISYATTMRVGQKMGKNDVISARLAGFVGIGIGATFMAFMGLIFWMFPQKIVGLYLDIHNPDNSQVIKIAISLLGIAAMFQMFDGIQVIAGGALRGLKDTRIPMLVGIFSYWFVGFLMGCLLGLYLRWGGVGLWVGLALGLSFTACILTWRFNYLINRQID